MEPVYYFGCVEDTGHFGFSPNKQGSLRDKDIPGPWPIGILDSRLAPTTTNAPGQCTLIHKDGWTAVAFWDYTVDKRPGSNSVFFTKGTLTFDEVIARAKEDWKKIWHRFGNGLTSIS